MKRFAGVWQLSADWPGDVKQQDAVYAAFHLEHGTLRHQLMHRLDLNVNNAGRHHLTIGFLPMSNLDQSGASGVNLSDRLRDPWVIEQYLAHGLGHVLDQRDMISPEYRTRFMEMTSGHTGSWMHEYQETFADHVRDWFISDGRAKAHLTAMLLP